MSLLRVRGARTHNLRDVSVDVPLGRLVVITGPSGSGKSSLAFGTIHAEGQRRYIEALGASVRRGLVRLPRPPVDAIEGLVPTVAVTQFPPPPSARATLGTLTEVDDFLRLLMARVGEATCPSCASPIRATHPGEVVAEVLALGDGVRVSIHAPVLRAAPGDHRALLEAWRTEGFVRARIDGADADLGEDAQLDPRQPHDVDLVIDRVVVKPEARSRIHEAVELAMARAGGAVRIVPREGTSWLRNERFVCATCGTALPDPEPALFSFNSPRGACTSCSGLGTRSLTAARAGGIEPELSIRAGALRALLGRKIDPAWAGRAATAGVDLDAPWRELPADAREWVLLGDGEAGGLLDRAAGDADASDRDDVADLRWFEAAPCDACRGARLRPEALAFRVGGRTIAEMAALPVRALRPALAEVAFAGALASVAASLRGEVDARLRTLDEAGLGYLSLDRAVRTLSGGEFQRARLAGQMAGGLGGVLYVLDEPTLGLHAADTTRLLRAVRALVDGGSSVLMVEHDLDAIEAADHVLDLGPGAGERGGRLLASAPPGELPGDGEAGTGRWLHARRWTAAPRTPRHPVGSMTVRGARLHTLRGIDATFPLGVLTVVSGVSGAGKTSLVLGTLAPLLRAMIEGSSEAPSHLGTLSSTIPVQRLVKVDATPLGRTPRSVPASVTGLLPELRALFAAMPEAKARGFKAARFSFNVKGGRCERCQGLGVLRVAMDFLPDAEIPCDLCGGARYEPETLKVRFRGWSIADVLAMTVDDALGPMEAIPRVRDVLLGLRDVGLGYLRLGQPVTSLSGGEAQRVRLAGELARRSAGHTVYLLDEPTAGLHPSDVAVLRHLLERLVDEGNSVICVTHHLDLVAAADHVVELGPGGGEEGGTVVAACAPEELRGLGTATGRALSRRRGAVSQA